MSDSPRPIGRQPQGLAANAPSAPIDSKGWKLPACRVEAYRAKRHRYCVAVFVINEGTRLHGQLEAMQGYSDQVDILIGDGGSTDGSTQRAELEGRGVRALLTKTGEGKLSAQMRMALAWALQEGYHGIIVIDGNGKDDVSAIPSFVSALDAGNDHVQGSRFIPGGQAINTPLARWLGLKLLHAPAISLASGQRCTDTTNGFRAYSRRLLLDPRVAPFRDVFQAYELHYYLAIRAARLGFRCTELPVTRAYPASGNTPTKISGVRGNWLILRTLARACFHRMDPCRAH